MTRPPWLRIDVTRMTVERMLTTPSVDRYDQWLRDQIALAAKNLKGRPQ